MAAGLKIRVRLLRVAMGGKLRGGTIIDTGGNGDFTPEGEAGMMGTLNPDVMLTGEGGTMT